jgi:hypothetical protein
LKTSGKQNENRVMNINSYISHRMFVAALSHDEAASLKDPQQQRGEEAARVLAAKFRWQAQLRALAETQAAMRRRTAPSVTGGF